MRIHSNLMANFAQRVSENNNFELNKNLEKLSSGSRINSASDDAAGLAVSEKLRSRIDSTKQVKKNLQDGISLLQTADGGYETTVELLQRLRSLAVQASNGTLTNTDRQMLQVEVAGLLSEIDRMETSVTFNNKQLLKGSSDVSAQDITNLQNYIKDSWAAIGQDIANKIFDTNNVGGDMTVVFDTGTAGGTLAYVQTWETTGAPYNITKQELHIELADFAPVTFPNGGSSPTFYNDRIIQHEMVHAVQAWESDGVYAFNSSTAVPTWFKEGLAEYSHGANDRVLYDGGRTAPNAIRSLDITSWGGTSAYYSSAYESVMYMNRTYGGGAGDTDGDGSVVDTIVTKMNAGQTFDQAVDFIDDGLVNGSLTGNGFVAAFNADAAYDATITADANEFYNGGAYNGTTGGYNLIELGASQTAEDTVDEAATPGLGGFNLTFQDYENTAISITAGPDANSSIDLTLDQINTNTLGIDSLDLSSQASAEAAISLLDDALNTLNTSRAKVGALQNRLEHSYNFAGIQQENEQSAESRIRDTDFAAEMTSFTKHQILSQASQSMLAQANYIPQQAIQQLLI